MISKSTIKRAALGIAILMVLLAVATLQSASAPPPPSLPKISDYGVTRVSSTSSPCTGASCSNLLVTITSTVGPIFVLQTQVSVINSGFYDGVLYRIETDTLTISFNPPYPVVIPGGCTDGCPPSYGEAVSKIPTTGVAVGLLVKEPMGNLAIPGATTVKLLLHGPFGEGASAAVIVTVSAPSTATVTVSLAWSSTA
jgi:hypothetical protein